MQNCGADSEGDGGHVVCVRILNNETYISGRPETDHVVIIKYVDRP